MAAALKKDKIASTIIALELLFRARYHRSVPPHGIVISLPMVLIMKTIAHSCWHCNCGDNLACWGKEASSLLVMRKYIFQLLLSKCGAAINRSMSGAYAWLL